MMLKKKKTDAAPAKDKDLAEKDAQSQEIAAGEGGEAPLLSHLLALRKVLFHCRDIGVSYLTVYAFSTENWKRSADEVGGLMVLLGRYLREAIDTMEKERIRLYVMGDLSRLSPELKALSDRALEKSKTVEGMQLNVCFSYGGRDEIVRAARRWAERVRAGEENALTEDVFASLLDSAGVPDPELLIRPGGEMRISNFLMWQTAYSEMVFTDTLWPDFGEKDINAAIAQYQKRDRRFGEL